MTAVLGRTLRRTKHRALLVLKESIKTETLSQAARMTAMPDRTLLLIKRHAPFASQENIKI